MFEGLPRSHFGTILADPPTRFGTWSSAGNGRSPGNHYRTMSDAELRSLPVAELAAKEERKN